MLLLRLRRSPRLLLVVALGTRSLEDHDSTAETVRATTSGMRLVLILPVLVVAAAGSLLAAGAAPAKDQPSTIYVDRAGGYRITVPRTWQIVPPNAAFVKRLAANLKKQKKTALAAAYSESLALVPAQAMLPDSKP